MCVLFITFPLLKDQQGWQEQAQQPAHLQNGVHSQKLSSTRSVSEPIELVLIGFKSIRLNTGTFTQSVHYNG